MKSKFKLKKLDIALIGAGKMGQHHIKAIAKSNHGRLVAIADPQIRDLVSSNSI